MNVVHYLNQFFAGAGGEEAAGMAPRRIEGAVGPGRGLGLDVRRTLACGDDYFGEHERAAVERLLAWLEDDRPDVFVCGPAFGSGRYGYACGVLAREASRIGIPAVAAMHPENPGVLAADGTAYIVPTEGNVAAMRKTLPLMAALATKLAEGTSVGSAQEEGYLPRSSGGIRTNRIDERTGAERAIDLLLSKLEGRVHTEISTNFDRVAPPPALEDVGNTLIALVTEAGCVPQGNPDHLPSRRSHVWLRYPIDGVASLSADRYETVHGGFDTAAAIEDPNRLVPLDAVRSLESAGRIGSVHPFFYTTSGVDTPVATAAKFGQEIAQELKDGEVRAVVLTGT